MRRSSILGLALAAVAAAGSSAAQEAGGVRIAPGAGGGPVGLAQLLPFTSQGATAADIHRGATVVATLHGGVPAADRRARHQSTIARLRGDGGYLEGFAFGQPLAVSRAPLAPPVDLGLLALQPIVIENSGGPIAIATGDGGIIQQQVANGAGPIAQQQVTTVARGAGGEAADGSSPGRLAIAPEGGGINLATGSGTIVQGSTPGARRGTGGR
jgi:hypothetical protein